MYIEPITAIQLAYLQRVRIERQARLERQWHRDHVERHPQAQWEQQVRGPGFTVRLCRSGKLAEPVRT
jgi:hypothetical protein